MKCVLLANLAQHTLSLYLKSVIFRHLNVLSISVPPTQLKCFLVDHKSTRNQQNTRKPNSPDIFHAAAAASWQKPNNQF